MKNKAQVKRDITRQIAFMSAANRLLKPGYRVSTATVTPHQSAYVAFLKAVNKTRRNLRYAQPHLSERERIALAKRIVRGLAGTPTTAARRLA